MADSTGQEPTEPGHTGAVAADPYDRMAWRDLYARSAALRERPPILAPGTARRGSGTWRGGQQGAARSPRTR
ncbi:hypothetical protein ACWGUL_29200, partial [Streptomyces albidoflavus]